MIPGLAEWARKAKRQLQKDREDKAEKEKQQRVKDEAERAALRAAQGSPDVAGAESCGAPGPKRPLPDYGKPTTTREQAELNFAKIYDVNLDRAIGNFIVEAAAPLVTAQQAAFREVVDTAIEYGHHVGKGVFKHKGQKRIRDAVRAVIPELVGEHQPKRLKILSRSLICTSPLSERACVLTPKTTSARFLHP